jgi:hypothetical protein
MDGNEFQLCHERRKSGLRKGISPMQCLDRRSIIINDGFDVFVESGRALHCISIPTAGKAGQFLK